MKFAELINNWLTKPKCLWLYKSIFFKSNWSVPGPRPYKARLHVNDRVVLHISDSGRY